MVNADASVCARIDMRACLCYCGFGPYQLPSFSFLPSPLLSPHAQFLTLEEAKKRGIRSARLPISLKMKLAPVLTVNQSMPEA